MSDTDFLRPPLSRAVGEPYPADQVGIVPGSDLCPIFGFQGFKGPQRAAYTRPSESCRSRKLRYGVNGDPLPEGKLDLPELREQPSPEEFSWAQDFIARRQWREAVTYRETAPHEYIVRRWESDAQGHHDFDRFITAIRRFGYADFYYRLRHIYWAVDEFKYWTMGWPVAETTVINRAHVDAPEPWKES